MQRGEIKGDKQTKEVFIFTKECQIKKILQNDSAKVTGFTTLTMIEYYLSFWVGSNYLLIDSSF